MEVHLKNYEVRHNFHVVLCKLFEKTSLNGLMCVPGDFNSGVGGKGLAGKILLDRTDLEMKMFTKRMFAIAIVCWTSVQLSGMLLPTCFRMCQTSRKSQSSRHLTASGANGE